MALITVGATPLQEPFEYTVNEYDADSESTGRTETYRLLRKRIYQNAYRIDVKWKGTYAEISTICGLIDDEEFAVTFVNGCRGTTYTRTMYSGNRTARLLKATDTSSLVASEWELSVALIDTCA